MPKYDMNKYFLIKLIRKIYQKIKGLNNDPFTPDEFTNNAEEASLIIKELLNNDSPCMIARYGSFELNTVLNARSFLNKKHSILNYIKGNEYAWWWENNNLKCLENNAGFFPINQDNIIKYMERMLYDTHYIDLLGSFCRNEVYLKEELKHIKKVHIKDIEPFYGTTPWTKYLEGKNVLVVHPLANLIKSQYDNKRTKLFKNPDILPSFNLITIQAVQSIGGECNNFQNWFDALQWMESEIDKVDYDICLIGCGAYGFPLAAHVKRKGKKAIHLGGILQFLFGIIGKRWEDPSYGVDRWGIPYGFYSNMINEYWIRPNVKPIKSESVENGCYW